MTPSKTLNPFEIYLKGPSAMTLSNISMANIAEKTTLLISTITVSSSGWLWYSMPIDRVLIRIANKIPEIYEVQLSFLIFLVRKKLTVIF